MRKQFHSNEMIINNVSLYAYMLQQHIGQCCMYIACDLAGPSRGSLFYMFRIHPAGWSTKYVKQVLRGFLAARERERERERESERERE